MAEPPPGVNTNLPEITEARPQTNRERMREHAINPACATCHNLIDPIGFGFEKFDAIGARRERLKLQFFGEYEGGHNQRKPKTVELPLDTSGQVAGLPDAGFSGPRELGAVLAEPRAIQRERLLEQPLGLRPAPSLIIRHENFILRTSPTRALLRRATDAFKQSQFRFKELMISLVRSREE